MNFSFSFIIFYLTTAINKVHFEKQLIYLYE